MRRKPTAYWEYLRIEDLLSLQGGLEGDDAELINDEVMFIVVHQIDELWFKLMVRELVSVRDLFAQERVPETALGSAVRGLRRLSLLFHRVASHFDLMETMTTRDYLSFRDKLSPASGFQSVQFREIEFLLGYKRRDMLAFHEPGTPARALLERRLAEPSVIDHFYAFLGKQGAVIPEDLHHRCRQLVAPRLALFGQTRTHRARR